MKKRSPAITYPEGEEIRWDGKVHPFVKNMHHYKMYVPKTHEEHIKYRMSVYRKASHDVSVQATLMDACKKDFLFWLNTFVWLVEPRRGEKLSGVIPFNTWCHQDPVAAALDHYFGTRHLIGDKSRAQGASYLEVANYVHKFIFRPFSLMGMGSKNEEAADSPDNPDSLGWKFDFITRNLPIWMCPPAVQPGEGNRKLKDHTWRNVLNGSYVKAYSATKGIGRSGRFTSFFLDESAFFPAGKDTEAVSNLLHTTNGIVMLSTPNGMNNEHYLRIHDPGPWLRVILDWRDNPDQAEGAYTTKKGRFRPVDRYYEWPDDYPFILDGRIRSPWYDRKCAENKHNMLMVGQELDREYAGSKGRPFPQEALDSAKETCRDPMHTGMLYYPDNEPERHQEHAWAEGEGYKFDLWVPIRDGKPPIGKYTVGCDISAGVGGDTSSNSAIEIINNQTLEQVGELAINTIPPEKFAQLAVAVCYWFGHGTPSTFLNWEKNGPGTRFTNELIRLNYPNVYRQGTGDELRKYTKRSDRPGYFTSDLQIALIPLISSLCSSDITFRSRPLLEECQFYILNDQGKVEHPKSKTSRDGGSRGVSHGDRPVGMSMCIMALKDRLGRKRVSLEIPQIPEKYSFAERLENRNKRAKLGDIGRCRW